MKSNSKDPFFGWRRHGAVLALVLTAWLIQGAGYWLVTGALDAHASEEWGDDERRRLSGKRILRKLKLATEAGDAVKRGGDQPCRAARGDSSTVTLRETTTNSYPE